MFHVVAFVLFTHIVKTPTRFFFFIFSCFVCSKQYVSNWILYGLSEFIWQLLLIYKKICIVAIALEPMPPAPQSPRILFSRSLSFVSSHHVPLLILASSIALIRFSISIIFALAVWFLTLHSVQYNVCVFFFFFSF